MNCKVTAAQDQDICFETAVIIAISPLKRYLEKLQQKGAASQKELDILMPALTRAEGKILNNLELLEDQVCSSWLVPDRFIITKPRGQEYPEM